MYGTITSITIGNYYMVGGSPIKITPENIARAFQEGCHSIPITAGILERNGFVLRYESEYRKEYELILQRRDDNQDYFCIELHEKGGYCKVYFNPLDSITHISYNLEGMAVHQLQDALRMCHIKKEIGV